MSKNSFITALSVVILGFQLSANAQAPVPKTLEELKALKAKEAERKINAPQVQRSHNPQITKALEKLKEKARTGWGASWNEKRTAVRTLRGTLPQAQASKISDPPDKIAIDFLKENRALFQMPAELDDLHVERSIEGMGSYYVTLRQTYNGLPVFNGHVRVSIGVKQKDIYLLHNYYVPNINIATTPLLSEEDVIAIAREDVLKNHMYETDKNGRKPYFGQMAFRKNPHPELGVFNLNESPVLVYKFYLDIWQPRSLLQYVINANTGEIIEAEDRLQRASARGKVFDPNPVNALNDTSLSDQQDSKDAVPNRAYSRKRLSDISHDAILGRYYLKGPYVDVIDSIEAPYKFSSSLIPGRVISAKRSFVFDRDEDEFEHVMVYYHIDVNQRYIQTLGLPPINQRSIKIDPHGADGRDESYYNPDDKYIVFGEGNVDDAEDADIILHEYGHAIQDSQANNIYYGCSTEKGAMGEGFGDYWQASSTNDISVKNGFDPACYGEWDEAPNCRRRVDGTKHYPEDITHECHDDGEIWSSVLWSLFNTLGKTAADQIILKSHFEIPDDPSFRDGGQALLDADRKLFVDGLLSKTHRDEICALLEEKGLSAVGCGLKVVISWDTPGADVDLHLRGPDGADYPGWYYVNDCAFYNRNPDWGIAGYTADNPILSSSDCITCAAATETINAYSLTDPGIYKVLLHYYSDHQLGPTNVTAQVFEGDVEVFNEVKTLGDNDVWIPYEFTKKEPHQQ
jgi:Zn-dependent metalloprotease